MAATKRNGLARFGWSVLGYNLLVIAWGAFVRASGSGAGCGRHWPLCNGEVVPQPRSIATVVEVTHRATSGIAVVAVVALMVLTLKSVPKGHRARRASIVSTVFILGEALIGAGLVLFELVAHDASMKRGLSMILHLGNTFLLLGALTVTAWSLTTEPRTKSERVEVAPREEPRGWLRALVTMTLVSVLFLGSSGAIAALGDTLFPAATLREGLAQDLSPLAHVFVRLRVLHPFIALGTGVLVFVTASVVRATSNVPRTRLLARVVTITFVAQFAVGLLNLSLLAPIAMQIVHLLMADALWIALVLMAWESLYSRLSGAPGVVPRLDERLAQRPIMSRNGPAPMSEVPPSTSNVDPVT